MDQSSIANKYRPVTREVTQGVVDIVPMEKSLKFVSFRR